MSYNPSDSTASNLPYATSNKPDSARSYFYDKGGTFVYRPFISTNEVLAYFPNPSDRVGHFSIIVNTDGILGSNGKITGGTNSEYWWKDGITDDDLVLKQVDDTTEFKYVNIINGVVSI